MAPARKGQAPRRTQRQQRQPPPQRQPRHRAAPPVPRAPRGDGQRLGGALARYDARSLDHLPGPRATAPYTVVRERVTFSVSSNTFEQSTVLIIGPYTQAGYIEVGEVLSSLVAVRGVATEVPGVSDTLFTSNLFDGISPKSKQLSMHSLHAELACTGTSSGVIPSGNVWAGAVTQPLSRLNGWTSYNAMARALQTRRSMRMFSSYETMTKPVGLCSYPLDGVAHSEFNWCAGSANMLDELHRSMTPLVFVVGPSAVRNDYTVSLTIEWRVREALDPILQSTHKQYVPSSESVWGQLSAHLSNAGGFIAHAAQDPGVQAAVRGAVSIGARYAPRVLALGA